MYANRRSHSDATDMEDRISSGCCTRRVQAKAHARTDANEHASHNENAQDRPHTEQKPHANLTHDGAQTRADTKLLDTHLAVIFTCHTGGDESCTSTVWSCAVAASPAACLSRWSHACTHQRSRQSSPAPPPSCNMACGAHRSSQHARRRNPHTCAQPAQPQCLWPQASQGRQTAASARWGD